MALHLVPLIIGATAGSLATYIYKDKSSQEKIKHTAQKISTKVKSFYKCDKKI